MSNETLFGRGPHRTTETSLEAWDRIRGQVSNDLRRWVCDHIANYGTQCSAQVARSMGKERVSISPRFRECQDWDLIEQDGSHKKCPVTGGHCKVFKLTGRPPKKPVRRELQVAARKAALKLAESLVEVPPRILALTLKQEAALDEFRSFRAALEALK